METIPRPTAICDVRLCSTCSTCSATPVSIHAANAGGVWQTVVFGFAGVNMDDDGVLSITPHMPHEWSSLTFRLHNRESWLEIRVGATNGVDVEVLDGPSAILRINGETVTVPGVKDVS